jgi:hypothetical protein
VSSLADWLDGLANSVHVHGDAGGVAVVMDDPISYEGDSILVDTNRMTVGQEYPLRYRGKAAVAVKQPDGSVDFYLRETISSRLAALLAGVRGRLRA